MASAGAWVESGDRSHPNLKLMDDELRPQSTYPGHEGDLRKLEGCHFSGDEFNFEQTLHKIRESQKFFEGDRSHQRLRQLDSLRATLTYGGWEEDFDRAEKQHLLCQHGYTFDTMIEGMKRKQAMWVGDCDHEDIRLLDSLCERLSYPGWGDDAKSALESHRGGYSLKYHRSCMTEKQRMFEGDRSHPRLVALDSLKLTYPGWQDDVNTVEAQHTGSDFWFADDINDNYRAVLAGLRRKQSEYVTGALDTSSMNPIQRKIVETRWTYPGFEDDVKRTKETFHVSLFKHYLERCQIQQMIHDNDYGRHPVLIKLDAVQQLLSYPDCQIDVERVKNNLCANDHDVNQKKSREMIQGMVNKQNVYNGIRPLGQDTIKRGENHFGKCGICWDAPRTHAFVPCGHLCACESCSDKMTRKGRKCPMCNQAATMAMEVYLP